MTLSTSKNITLKGMAMIDNVQVVSLTATITTDGGNSYTNNAVINESMYRGNTEAIRKDIAEFQDLLYSEEDSIKAEASNAPDMLIQPETQVFKTQEGKPNFVVKVPAEPVPSVLSEATNDIEPTVVE